MSAAIHPVDLRRTPYVGAGGRSLTIADIDLAITSPGKRPGRRIIDKCGLQARRQRSVSAKHFPALSLVSPRTHGTPRLWSSILPAEGSKRLGVRGGGTQSATPRAQRPHLPHHITIARRSTVKNFTEIDPMLHTFHPVSLVGHDTTGRRNHSLRSDARNVAPSDSTKKQNNASAKLLRRRSSILRKVVPNGLTAGKEGADGFGHSRDNSEDTRKPKHSRFKEPGDAREFLRHMTRLFMICLRWVAILENRDDSLEYQIKTFTDLTIELEEEEETRDFTQEAGLAFDKNYFKVKRDITLSSEVKRILTLHPRARTKDTILQAQRGLQTLGSFAEYPLHMQEKFCTVAWLQSYPAKKVIVREGHEAENFYFLLSGQAILRKGVKDEITGQIIPQTVGKIHRGQTFGEEALLGGAVRDVTIESIGEVKLLVIRAEEFLCIGNTIDDGDEPEHIRFCRQIDFLKEWPVDELVENSEFCLFNYYRRGAVVVRDSTDTEYIYIVKSGTCQVLKELREVIPRSTRDVKRGPDFHFPRLGTTEPGPKVDNRRVRQKLEVTVPTQVSQAMAEFHNTQHETNHNQPNIATSTAKEEEIKTTSESERSAQLAGMQGNEAPVSSGPAHAAFRLKPAFLDAERGGDISSCHSERLSADRPTCDDTMNSVRQVYVQVEKLRPRDVFGLQYVKFSGDLVLPDTKLSMVSCGAELILLNRKFFIQHANERVKRYIRQNVRPYPGDDTLQENLQTASQWNSFKSNVISETLLPKRGTRDFRLST